MITAPRRLLALVILPLLGTILAAGAAEPVAKLAFVEVPADRSGLQHVLNSDPKLGEMKYIWMSSLVDIDGDGKLDILAYGHHGGGAAVWLGKGDGTFTLDDRGYTQRWQFGGRDPIWIDLNGSGAPDAIGTEGAGVAGRVFLNEGKGHWRKTALVVDGTGIGGVQLADLDGDGYHREIFITGGSAQQPEPPVTEWARTTAAKLGGKELWQAEKLVGWPEGIARGAGPGRAMFREAYAVDLNGDHKNELIIHFKGGDGFSSKQLYSWVLTRDADAWKDGTTAAGLPTGPGHWFYPEDIDVDGNLDIADLHTGEWYRNDGQGRFTLSPQRIFDPAKRLTGRIGHPWTADNEQQWLDLDNNGYRDFVTATDHGSEHGTFLNLGGGRFVEVAGIPGARRTRKFGDVNGDHKLDMVSMGKDQLTLHRNETPQHGLHIRLVPRVPSDAFLGAKIWVYPDGKLGDPKALVHYRQGFMDRDGGRSHNLLPTLHVGLGQMEKVDIRVRFPSGEVREARGVKADTLVTIPEVQK
ncbi:MAG: CRTAC1 family protein [Planctomycetia bacterium]|nr:CRTAC1 family protein [Planctomycetia bacterium]